MLSTSSYLIHNNSCIGSIYNVSKRYRKKSPPKKYWRYMYRGRNPFGPKDDETEEERELRENRVLKNRRFNGRSFIDWISMPHLQYVINNKDPNKSCRMMMREWKKYPEATYWTVTRVIPDRYQCDVNALHDEDVKQEWEEKIVATPPKKCIAYGKLTWRGVHHKEERRIDYLRWRGWIWIPCEQWLRHDQTKSEKFKPICRKEGRLAVEF
eukprot:138171_1